MVKPSHFSINESSSLFLASLFQVTPTAFTHCCQSVNALQQGPLFINTHHEHSASCFSSLQLYNIYTIYSTYRSFHPFPDLYIIVPESITSHFEDHELKGDLEDMHNIHSPQCYQHLPLVYILIQFPPLISRLSQLDQSEADHRWKSTIVHLSHFHMK